MFSVSMSKCFILGFSPISFISFHLFSLPYKLWIEWNTRQSLMCPRRHPVCQRFVARKPLWVRESNKRYAVVAVVVSSLGGANSLWKHRGCSLSQFRGLKSEAESAAATMSSRLQIFFSSKDLFSSVLLLVLVLVLVLRAGYKSANCSVVELLDDQPWLYVDC